VRLKVDVIVSAGVAATRAAKQATSTIPIVMSAATDPLGAGLISSLARPGGNITGSAMLSELEAKRLELLTEALPKASRVVALYDPATSPTVLREAEAAAERLKLRFNVVSVRTPEDLDSAFRKAKEWQAAALAVLASPLFSSQRVRIAELALVGRLPAIFASRLYVEAGGLMSYGPDLRAAIRHAAVLVDKILKGAKPADLPVEQPTKFELVINLKAQTLKASSEARRALGSWAGAKQDSCVVSRPALDETQCPTRGRNSLAEALKFPANCLQADSFRSFVLRRQICLFSGPKTAPRSQDLRRPPGDVSRREYDR
jgi:ABC transporter substrate binding protein